MALIWWGACNLVVICKIFGWCLIMFNMFKNGSPWLVMFTTPCTTKCSTLQFATCKLNPQKLCVSCGKKWIKWCSNLVLQTPISKGSSWIVHMPIRMLSISCTILEMPLWRWLTRNKLACSIRFSHSIDTQNSWLHQSYKNDTSPCLLNIRMQHLWKKQMFDMLQFGFGGILQGL